MKKSLFFLFIPFLFLGTVFAGAPSSRDFREIVATAKRKVQPAVLYVVCISKNVEHGEMISENVSGSAFLISEDGEFVTNWHVVDKATSIRCLLSDGRHFEAECLGSDKSMDIALCKLKLPEDEKVPFASFGKSSELEEGTFVIALGAPWGLNRSLTFGAISCTKRYLDGQSEYNLWLQTDASIGPGNSGGPLINTRGEVVGINALGTRRSSANFGFAIPSDNALEILDRLRRFGKVNWSWSGLALQPLNDFERDIYFPATNGVIVAGTDPDSPAEKSGLKSGDRIVSVNGKALTARTAEALPDIRRFFGFFPEADPIHLRVMRGGEEKAITIEPRAKGKVEGEEREFKRWDFSAKEINQFDTPDLYRRRQKGVFILGTKRDGNARGKLRENDIILTIDSTPIETLDDLSRLHEKMLKDLSRRHKIFLSVLRGGRTVYVVVDFLKDNDK